MTDTRVALVTGANRGIGFEIARQLARLGYTAVMGVRDVDKGRTAAVALHREGLEVPVVLLDTAREGSAERAVGEVLKHFGRLDVLVNNAAILIDGPGGFQASLFDLTAEVARRTFETNLIGPLRLIQAAAPPMREAGYGRIVNLSSGAGQLANMSAGFPAYRMSKAALNALTRIAASELASDGIKVNAACPGWVRTSMGGLNAERTVAQGAETPVWLATLPHDGPTGSFFRDKRPIAW